MCAHLRSEAHTYLSNPHLPPVAVDKDAFTVEKIRERIKKAKTSFYMTTKEFLG